jgi:hypothetical protein
MTTATATRSGIPARKWDAWILIEIAIVVVLVSHLAAFIILRNNQVRYDGEARAIAAWMHDHGRERLAWPEELRAAVPTLLDSGVTPVLVDSEVAPQQLAVNDTDVAVTHGTSDLADISRGEFEAGSLTARVVDLEAAATMPLRPGEFVGQDIARPYRYAPLRDSRPITSDDPFRTTLTLSPGRYVFAVEAFAPERGVQLLRSVAANGQTLAASTGALALYVLGPAELAFAVRGTDTQAVMLRVAIAGGGDSTAFMHGWSVTRLDRTQ